MTSSGSAIWGLQVDSNADGDLVVAWASDDLVKSALRQRGGGWSGTRTWGLGPSDLIARLTGVRTTIGPEGRALVVWSVTDVWSEARHRYENYVAWARSTRSGAWSPSRTLTRSLGEDGGGLTLSMNSSGAAVASWYQNVTTDTPSRVWAARFRPDGIWGAPLRVSWSEAYQTAAFMDRRGKAHVVIQSGRRLLAFKQSSGRPWSSRTVIGTGTLLDASGRGLSLVALYGSREGERLLAVARD